jgi:hypothetical protein
LVGGEGFAVDASLIEADANRQRSIPGVEWKKQIDPTAASRQPTRPCNARKRRLWAVNGPETCTVSLFPSDSAPQVAEDLSYELVQRQAVRQIIAAAEPGRTQPEKNLRAWFHTQIRKLLARGET